MISVKSLQKIESWPVDHAAVSVVTADGEVLGTAGDQDRRFRLASVTKLLSAYAVLVSLDEGALELDQPAGTEGSTVRHLLAHSGGYDFGERTVRYTPGTRRLYSNAGFEVLGETLEQATGMAFGEYLREGVLVPLGMSSTTLEGSPAAGAVSTAADLSRFAAELQAPTLTDPGRLTEATQVVFPGLAGVLPGFGRQKENDWGLGFEIRAQKSPHWTGANSSPATFGHFGQSGTFLWVDPAVRAAAVCLTDRDFGPWAAEVWPPFTDGLLAELADR
ncbi:beta-lactamase family protein [Arthrobacter sp. zg-Y859]|uniref:Beta-lactamase family protein n=1 Tax=Arthrobacter jinronghuae TaxID=2964609 RepID=A0ABT1NS80_9MICC|nr:beta-lactamase family protein [Arthrobacter jinronghuae]MCQ1956272.1 beta-lactamase family protein [Arthrobacter jinronghuae]UWX77536.1 beta-lactamase family protein [Arthrobacter jinronghuae]